MPDNSAVNTRLAADGHRYPVEHHGRRFTSATCTCCWCQRCLHPAHVGVCLVRTRQVDPSPLTTVGTCGCVVGSEHVRAKGGR